MGDETCLQVMTLLGVLVGLVHAETLFPFGHRPPVTLNNLSNPSSAMISLALGGNGLARYPIQG